MQQNQLTKGESIWLGFIFLAVIFSAAEAPFTFTFNTRLQGWQVIADIIISCLFFGDLVYAFKKFNLSKQLPLSQQVSKRKFYTMAVIDILACIPFDLLFYLFGGAAFGSIWKTLRLVRLVRIVKVVQFFNSLNLVPRWLKMSMVSVATFILIHWFTCVWICIHPLMPGADRTYYYVKCFYWTVTTLTTVGYGDITPTTITGRIYTMIVMFLGVGFYGFVIGNVTQIFAESARYKEQTREKFNELNSFMKHYHIPGRLQNSVFNYYNHLYTKRFSDNDSKIISELPQALKVELQVYMNMKLIRNLPVFKFCTQACLKEVASALEQQFYGPSDTIIRTGELGDEMYVIGHGVVDVILEDGSIVAQLHEGQFFGEAALLKETTRNANVRASTYTDLYRLSKEDFIRIIELHPELLENMENVTSRRKNDRRKAENAHS